MKKLVSLTTALILILLTFASCTLPKYRNVVEVVGQTETPSDERVLVCNIYDGDNSMKYLSVEDADIIASYLPYDKTWDKKVDDTSCISDILIVFDDERYYYCSECGTLKYYEEGGRSHTLQDEERTALESALKKYVSFGTSGQEKVTEETTASSDVTYFEMPVSGGKTEGKIKDIHCLYSSQKTSLTKLVITGKNKPDYDIYYCGLDYVNVRTEKGTYELSYAIENGIVTAEDLSELSSSDPGHAGYAEYRDGGTKEFKYKELTIIEMHKIEGEGFNEDLVICSRGLSLNDIPEKETAVSTDYLTGKEKEYTGSADGLAMSVLVPEKAEYGKPLYISAKITNTGDETIEYTLPVCDYISHNDITIDISGEDYYFTDIWDLGRIFCEATRKDTLAPGESYEEIFMLMPGTVVTGTLNGNYKYKMFTSGEYSGRANFNDMVSVDFKIVIE